MISIEFHCHTIYSKDSLVAPARLVETCIRKGIDRIVITDHNTIAGAVEAQKMAPGLVIVGEEIMTTKGELLAAYVTEEIPAGLSPQDAIRRLKEQGAFISVSHPFDSTRRGHWQEGDLLEILPFIDAIETFNARCLLPDMNHQADEFAARHGVASTVGSDAHSLFELGRATLTLPQFEGPEELRAVIRQGVAQTRRSGILARAASRYAVLRKITSRSL
ncbi:MAG: PHP domain-containing protein [Anaerolineales bacterium]|uniref:PHP domain-containing protein n=1 Tax=Candidatus Desulfolinea nitratireducens TaxID=2841698 RepID=A0A8J6NMR9_9CHLR|nr:PHP domain-containing protein [Candidatus Desulfolinea nitratireducens]MBL6961538.1 PHP domain-containing protein [Anaerolineales bacterium]